MRAPSTGWTPLARSVVARTVLLALAWWALVEGDRSVLVYGVALVPLTVALTYHLTGAPRAGRRGRLRRARALLGLTGWLVARALVGSVDVARRAVTPRVDVDPFWTTWTTSLPPGVPRAALALVMNLMPGSLSAHVDDDRIAVHVISPDLDVEGMLADLERRLARLWGD